MATLKLAANLAGIPLNTYYGHLQIVKDSGSTLTELEIKPEKSLFGNWLFATESQRPIDHKTKTPYYGVAGKYKIVDLDIGNRNADDVWSIWNQSYTQLANYNSKHGISYDNNQNSNSFVTTMMKIVGLDVSSYISKVKPTDVDSFRGYTTDVLIKYTIDLDLKGTKTNDYIKTGWGDDTLTGGDDNDTLYGGSGNDSIKGGNHDDAIYGENGDDSLLGDAGNDTVKGYYGDDLIFGGTGNDYLYGDSGNDSLAGEAGNDYLHGGYGDDYILGLAGNNTLAGGDGNDVIYGGDNNDTIYGNVGVDIIGGNKGINYLYGDVGEDYYVVTAIPTKNGFYDFEGKNTINDSDGNFIIRIVKEGGSGSGGGFIEGFGNLQMQAGASSTKFGYGGDEISGNFITIIGLTKANWSNDVVDLRNGNEFVFDF